MHKQQPSQQSESCMHAGFGQAFMAPGGSLPMADRLAPGELDGTPPWPKPHSKDLPSDPAILTLLHIYQENGYKSYACSNFYLSNLHVCHAVAAFASVAKSDDLVCKQAC